jgi:hypothetical protein
VAIPSNNHAGCDDPEVVPRLREQAYEDLDSALPLALFPVRLEVRFDTARPPERLRLRIFPDVLVADAHVEGLTVLEQKLAQQYWQAWWQSAADDATAAEAFAWLAEQLEPWRAAYVASRMKPRNVDEVPSEPVESIAPGTIAWPRVATSEAPEPARARLLPDRWAVVGYLGGRPVRTWWSKPVERDLAMAPALVDLGDEEGVRSWLDVQDLRWIHDFDTAVDVGMAVDIALTELDVEQRRQIETEGFSTLLVLGLQQTDRSDGAKGLRNLLRAQRFTRGIDFVAQGTPTNNTDTVVSGVSVNAPDLNALRKAELDGESVEGNGRDGLSESAEMFHFAAADAASAALGMQQSVLDRLAGAANYELRRAAAMNRCLWPASLGHYFNTMFGDVVSDGDLGWLQGWFVDFVRGAGPLPTLRIADVPYGLLPVTPLVRRDPATNAQRLEQVVLDLWAHWDRSRQLSALTLDPDATDVGAHATPVDNVEVLAQLLASVPHPTQLLLRRTDPQQSEYAAKYGARIFMLAWACLRAPDEDGDAYFDLDDNEMWQEWLVIDQRLKDARDLRAQIDALEDMKSYLDDRTANAPAIVQRSFAKEWSRYTRSHLLDFLEEHDRRIEPAWDLGLGSGASSVMADEDDPATFFAFYATDEEATPWATSLVAPGHEPSDIDAIVAWLDELIAVIDGGGEAPDPATELPLLRQLCSRSVAVVAPGAASELRAGLRQLRTMVAERAVSDPVSELERLMRETLGLSAHRLDAWVTSLAARRLGHKRTRRRRGLHLGAYGLLVDVAPRQAGASEGYVFAPTLDHANTAALLRSGWAAFGGRATSSPLAIDLSSERLRRARYLVEGVRRGQALSELLGSRFERRLHEAELDHWTSDIREVVLDATGDPSPPNRVVDGLVLARAYAPDATADEAAVATAVDARVTSDQRRVHAVLDELVADLDSVADGLLTQAVHSLARGDDAVASATLSATGSGDGPLPPLDVAKQPRIAQVITHRVALLLQHDLPASRWPGAASSGRALASPELERWLSTVLLDPRSLTFEATVRDEEGQQTQVVALADTRLAAIDLVALSAGGKLQGYLEAHAATLWDSSGTTTIDAGRHTAVGDDDVSIDEQLLGVRPLRNLLWQSRHLHAADLVPPDEEPTLDETNPQAIDVAALGGLLADGREALQLGGSALELALPEEGDDTPRGDIANAMLGLIGFPLARQLPSGNDTLVEDGRGLLAAVEERLSALSQRELDEADASTEWTDAEHAEALLSRLRVLVGPRMPIAPRFTPVNTPTLASSRDESPSRLGGTLGVSQWLDRVAAVRPAMQKMQRAIHMLEAVADDLVVRHVDSVQLPFVSSEPWAASAKPSDDDARLCGLGICSGGEAYRLDDGAARGLILDSWTESIPLDTATAGVAVHFDAPSARAPQAILLAVVEDETGFSFSTVRDLVHQTLDLAKLRAVGPQTLVGLGQFLPATYLAGNTNPGGPNDPGGPTDPGGRAP